MADSYNRRCVYCGKWIQMRQMPYGQWVPFNDDNTVHTCDRQFAEYNKENHPSKNYAHSNNDWYSQKSKESDDNGCLTFVIIIVIIIIIELLSSIF